MQYGRRSGILFSSFVIYERERFCFFAAQGAAGDRRRSAAFFLRARWGEGREAFHAPGRKLRFLRFPVLTQSYAALPARPRFARTLRGHCAPDGAWAWVTSGALPRENHGDRRDKAAQIFRARQGVKAKAYWRYVEPQTTRHCAKRQAVLARRPPRFFRPGREVRFLHLLVFTQSHAAELARPRYARTLRDSFMRPRAAWAWATLGALPLKPHQGTEFPGPSTFFAACLRQVIRTISCRNRCRIRFSNLEI